MKIIKKSGEDYLEAAFNLFEKNGYVRSIDIATALGVTKPSAFRALKILSEQGYIQKESYGEVIITEKGIRYAQGVQKKHKAIRMLLINHLGISPQTAEIDACKIEHCLSEETTEKLYDFLKMK